MSERKTAISIEHVSIRLGGTEVLTDACASVPMGSSTAIVGPNGAGKTSLALAILGQEQYTGKISFPAYGGRMPRFGFVPQKLQFDRDMPLTVMDYLLSGIQRLPLFLGKRKRMIAKVMMMLEEVECEYLADRRFGALSGGEIQRVLMAQALLCNPEILVLDEPTSGVDIKGGQVCCELLHRIRAKRGFTELTVSHDLATVAAHAEHVICLKGRVVGEGAPKEVLNHKVLTDLFGLHLGVASPDDLAVGAEECSNEKCPFYFSAHHAHHATHSGDCACSCHHEHKDEVKKDA